MVAAPSSWSDAAWSDMVTCFTFQPLAFMRFYAFTLVPCQQRDRGGGRASDGVEDGRMMRLKGVEMTCMNWRKGYPATLAKGTHPCTIDSRR